MPVPLEAFLAAGTVAALGLAGWSLHRQRRLERRLARRPRVEREVVWAGSGAGQRIGLVRFNAYHDTGGEYSFALAFIDAAGDGVVLSGLYHRERCRVYAKPVARWASETELIDEEQQAIARARDGSPTIAETEFGPVAAERTT
jgi:hypothetical protein